MGVNIHIDCKGWDAFANAGMKEILYDNEKFPKIYPKYNAMTEEINEFRPLDFEKWRVSISKLGFNIEMWMRGLDYLEKNPHETAYYSY